MSRLLLHSGVKDSDRSQPLVVHLGVDELEAVVRRVVRDEFQAALEAAGCPEVTDRTEGELEPLLTASQLAEVLNCGVRTLKRWLQEGVAPPPLRTPGSRLRWYRSDVKRWIEQRSEEPRAQIASLGTHPSPTEPGPKTWRRAAD